MIFFLIILCIPAITAIGIMYLVSARLMKLYVVWYIVFALLFYAWTIQQPSFTNKRFSGMDDEVFWLNIIVSAAAIAIRLVCTYLINLFNKANKSQPDWSSRAKSILRKSYYATAIVYGWLAAYFIYLFHGDRFSGYRPAYSAYVNVFIYALILFMLANILHFVRWENKFETIKKCINSFAYSLTGTIYALLIFSLSIPIAVVKATESVIQSHHQHSQQKSISELKYCIQTVGRRTRTSSITAKLDLSPLTMHSKAPLGNIYGWGNAYYHALLVVERNGFVYLYNWSYRQKKWLVLPPNFAEEAMIDKPKIVCTPQHNYLATIPWILPQK